MTRRRVAYEDSVYGQTLPVVAQRPRLSTKQAATGGDLVRAALPDLYPCPAQMREELARMIAERKPVLEHLPPAHYVWRE